MHHFHSKSLVFYGLAIGLVLVLFKVVTDYGEKNLQAPPILNSHYRLNWKKNVNNCDKLAPLILNVQQSGIYLNASLSPTNATPQTTKPSTLTGIFQHQQLSLTGKIDQGILCNISQPESIQAQIQLVDQRNLQGQIIISNISQTLEFNATPEAAQAAAKNSHSH